MNYSPDSPAFEAKLRKQAQRLGYKLTKSRKTKLWTIFNNQGSNIYGQNDLDIYDVCEFLEDVGEVELLPVTEITDGRLERAEQKVKTDETRGGIQKFLFAIVGLAIIVILAKLSVDDATKNMTDEQLERAYGVIKMQGDDCSNSSNRC